ncbi:hypothetical protein FKM82_028803 [Ascaphus truei]
MPGLPWTSNGGNHWHIQIPRHRLVRSRSIPLVESKLLGPGGKVLPGRPRGVHVLVCEGSRLGARLDGVVVGHPARVVPAAKVAVGQAGAGGALRRRAGAALLGRLGHLARGVGRGQGSRVPHQVPALAGGGESAAGETFHVFTHLIQAVVVEEHDRLDPAWAEER